MNRPETRIIKQKLWDACQQRVVATFERYTRKADAEKKPTGIARAKVTYLLSGLLVCAECNSPLTLSVGTNAAYYRCQTNRKQGTCTSRISLREESTKRRILEAFERWLVSPAGVQAIRKNIAKELGEQVRTLETQINDRRERLQRTELKIRGPMDFIATGDKSDYVVSTMRDLEAYARTEKAEIAALIEESREPIALPSIEDLIALPGRQEAHGHGRGPGREMLRRYLAGGVIRCAVDEDGPYASCDLGAHILLSDMQARNRRNPGSGSSPRDSQVLADGGSGGASWIRSLRLGCPSSVQLSDFLVENRTAATRTTRSDRLSRRPSCGQRCPIFGGDFDVRKPHFLSWSLARVACLSRTMLSLRARSQLGRSRTRD